MKFNPVDPIDDRLQVLELLAMELGVKPERMRQLIDQVREKKERQREQGCAPDFECVRPLEDRTPKCWLLESVGLRAQLQIVVAWFHEGAEREALVETTRAIRLVVAGKVDELDDMQNFLLRDAIASCRVRTIQLEECLMALNRARDRNRQPDDSNGSAE